MMQGTMSLKFTLYDVAQRRNHLTTHFLERIPVVKRRISVHPKILSRRRRYIIL